MDRADDFSDLSLGAMAMVGAAVTLSLLGTLIGLAGLLMWGIKAFDTVFPLGGDPPLLVATMAPYLSVFNFVLMVAITVLGILNLMLATRWHEFLQSGWRRWLAQSVLSLIAAGLFVWVPHATQ
jgi:hypothetical protein